jgi:hypothetical protein
MLYRPLGELVVMTQDRLGVGGLQRGAAAIGMNQFEIIFADHQRSVIGNIRQMLSRRVGERRDRFTASS